MDGSICIFWRAVTGRGECGSLDLHREGRRFESFIAHHFLDTKTGPRGPVRHVRFSVCYPIATQNWPRGIGWTFQAGRSPTTRLYLEVFRTVRLLHLLNGTAGPRHIETREILPWSIDSPILPGLAGKGFLFQ